MDEKKNGLPFSMALWQTELNRMVKRQLEYFESPFYKRMVAESRARWLAKPWYERAAIRAKAKIEAKRERLGEFIAGRRFGDE